MNESLNSILDRYQLKENRFIGRTLLDSSGELVMKYIESKENKRLLIKKNNKPAIFKLVTGEFEIDRSYEFSLYTFYNEKQDCYISGVDTKYNLPILLDGITDPFRLTMEDVIIGETYEGIVVKINDYGAFVRIGLLVGLIHKDDITYELIKNPNEKLTVGQLIVAKVIDIIGDKISLGLKQLYPDPWNSPDLDLLTGSVVDCVIKNVKDYGLQVELKPGIIGLIHITELFWDQVSMEFVHHKFNKNQKLRAQVITVDKEKRTIALSLKPLKPDPWINISQFYRVGQIVGGQVMIVDSYALIVLLKNESVGIIHISDLSYNRHYDRCNEYAKVGDKIKGVIQSINADERQLHLSIKHMEPT
jgi:small subunit ribosomal protein S1